MSILYILRNVHGISLVTGVGFLFVFNAWKQAHRRLRNCCHNAEDGQKDKLVQHLFCIDAYGFKNLNNIQSFLIGSIHLRKIGAALVVEVISCTFISLLLVSGFCHAAETAVPVRVAVVTREAIQEQIPITGSLTAVRRSSLSSRVDGLVAEVLVEAGDLVAKGDVLIKLDKVLADFDEQRAGAALAEAKARLQESIRLRDELKKLVKKQYLAKTSYETSVSEVNVNSAIVKRLQAAYRRDLELVTQHRITAPYSGVISQKAVEAGEWIKVGDRVLELVDIDILRVEVDVPQRYFSRLQVKTPATVFSDAIQGQPIAASISRIIPVASATAHTFPVHIEINNELHRYTPGMTARVVFLLAESGSLSMSIPRDAVIKTSQHQDNVWVIKQEQNMFRVYPVNVNTGRVYQNQIEILEGDLKPGQQVVIRGNEILKPGQSVRVVP